MSSVLVIVTIKVIVRGETDIKNDGNTMTMSHSHIIFIILIF